MGIKTPLLLVILDGLGIGDENDPNNAVARANTPNLDAMKEDGLYSKIDASGEVVGLPSGEMGNSEVGHISIGSGRIIEQDYLKASNYIKNDGMDSDEHLLKMAADIKRSGSDLHIIGMASDGGVHGHMDHMLAQAEIMANKGVNVKIHAITDGRDCAPKSASQYLSVIEDKISENPLINIATVTGRYYAMDRDNKWDRVQIAYDAIVSGEGENTSSFSDSISALYDDGVTDEFFMPMIADDYDGFAPNDGLIFSNYRADRARQLAEVILLDEFDGFERGSKPNLSSVVAMAPYRSDIDKHMGIIFPKENILNTFAQVVSEAGLEQLHAAETQKYAHVTFFFNGGREKPFPNEDHVMVPSPDVATFDLKPEMAAPELSEKIQEAIAGDKYDVYVINFANPDMVGHTGNLGAAIKAIEAVDKELGAIRKLVHEKSGVMVVTADHGNADIMVNNETGDPHTAHTANLVPFIIDNFNDQSNGEGASLRSLGTLADIAPTMLDIMRTYYPDLDGLGQPDEMTGQSMIVYGYPEL